jgi:hypothetical protein
VSSLTWPLQEDAARDAVNGKESAPMRSRGTGWRVDRWGDSAVSPTWNHMRNAYPEWYRKVRGEDGKRADRLRAARVGERVRREEVAAA